MEEPLWDIVYDLVGQLSWKVTSADKAYRMLREWGYEVPRAKVREMWREYNLRHGYEGPISQWPLERKIPRAWVTTRPTKVARGFMHVFEYEVYDPLTGKVIPDRWSTVTEELTSFAELWEKAEKDIKLYVERMGGELVDMRPSAVVEFAPQG